MQKLEGAPGIEGVRMPHTPPYLTTGQIADHSPLDRTRRGQ